MSTILKATDIKKTFGGLVAVNGLSINIPRNSISAVIGPNGAGKTTFFNCITGFYKIDSGEVLFDGEAIQNRRTDQISRIGISRTYQNIRLFNSTTAIENVLVGLEPRLKTSVLDSVFRTPRFYQEE